MNDYRVFLTETVTADSPLAAAVKARELQSRADKLNYRVATAEQAAAIDRALTSNLVPVTVYVDRAAEAGPRRVYADD